MFARVVRTVCEDHNIHSFPYHNVLAFLLYFYHTAVTSLFSTCALLSQVSLRTHPAPSSFSQPQAFLSIFLPQRRRTSSLRLLPAGSNWCFPLTKHFKKRNKIRSQSLQYQKQSPTGRIQEGWGLQLYQ